MELSGIPISEIGKVPRSFFPPIWRPAPSGAESCPGAEAAAILFECVVRAAAATMSDAKGPSSWQYVKGINDYGKETTYMYLGSDVSASAPLEP